MRRKGEASGRDRKWKTEKEKKDLSPPTFFSSLFFLSRKETRTSKRSNLPSVPFTLLECLPREINSCTIIISSSRSSSNRSYR